MVPACSNSVSMVAGDDEDEEEHKKRVKSLKKDEAGNKRPSILAVFIPWRISNKRCADNGDGFVFKAFAHDETCFMMYVSGRICIYDLYLCSIYT